MSGGASALAHIRDAGIVPVIRAESSAMAIDVAAALIDAGLTIVEITMTVPDAIAAIESLRKTFGHDITLGAGTITSPAMAESAIAAGCTFLVTPCLLPDVVAAGQTRHIPVICGALTPTEIFAAHSSGAQMVKVFPAGAVGGPDYIRAIRGPFPHIALMATGGVSLETIPGYLAAGVEAVGVGGELISKTAIKSRDFAAIGRNARLFVDAVRQARQNRHP